MGGVRIQEFRELSLALDRASQNGAYESEASRLAGVLFRISTRVGPWVAWQF
jgi:hypothetical protein